MGLLLYIAGDFLTFFYKYNQKSLSPIIFL